MSQPSPNGEPLGLPRGSVRAILAIMIVAATLYMVAATGVMPQALTGMAGVVVGWYFGARGANGVR